MTCAMDVGWSGGGPIPRQGAEAAQGGGHAGDRTCPSGAPADGVGNVAEETHRLPLVRVGPMPLTLGRASAPRHRPASPGRWVRAHRDRLPSVHRRFPYCPHATLTRQEALVNDEVSRGGEEAMPSRRHGRSGNGSCPDTATSDARCRGVGAMRRGYEGASTCVLRKCVSQRSCGSRGVLHPAAGWRRSAQAAWHDVPDHTFRIDCA